MNDPRVLAATRAAAGPIEAAGAVWMLHPEQLEASTQAGYPHPFAGYAAGRGGVLGDVPAEVVDSVFAVFEPSLIQGLWNGGIATKGAKESAELYFRQCAEWGARHLAGVEGLDRFIALGERIIAAAPTAGLPLFAGTKALPRVDDVPGRAMQVLHVLRELQGGVHLAAVTAAGLTMPEAHRLNKDDPEYIGLFGWPDASPPVEHLKAVRDEVEERTSARLAAILASALSAEEAEELAAIAAAIHAKVSG